MRGRKKRPAGPGSGTFCGAGDAPCQDGDCCQNPLKGVLQIGDVYCYKLCLKKLIKITCTQLHTNALMRGTCPHLGLSRLCKVCGKKDFQGLQKEEKVQTEGGVDYRCMGRGLGAEQEGIPRKRGHRAAVETTLLGSGAGTEPRRSPDLGRQHGCW